MDYRIEKILGKTPSNLYLPDLSKSTKFNSITTPTAPNCRNPNFLSQPYLCKLVNRYKHSNSILSSQDYLSNKATNRQGRSYYGSYGHGAPAAPTYYP